MNPEKLMKLMQSRRSIRIFEDKQVEMKKIKQIAEAGISAPSSLNSQPWEFIIVRKKANKKRIRELYDKATEELRLYKQNSVFLENAALITVVSHSKRKGHMLSCAAAIQNMLLMAESLGLKSCWTMRAFGVKETAAILKKMFNLREEFELIGIIAVGYSNDKPEPKPKKAIEEVIHTEQVSF